MRSFGWILLVGAGCEQSIEVVERLDEDRFTQPTVVQSADVLFVIDDSKSMLEEQSLLQAGVAAFLAVLGETETDYRFAVVTTDTSGEDAGVARGGVLDPFMTGVEALAAEALAVGTSGAKEERGLAAAILATNGSRNPGFPRDDAHLDVVVISDEDDQSNGEVTELLGALAAHAPPAGFAVHGVLGDLPGGCASPAGAADPAPRYHEVVVETAGRSDSICAESYVEVLEQVGFQASGLRDSFPLTALPQVESMEVRVDDVLLHPRDVDGWTWDPGENTVVFHGRAVPRGGMEIVIRYARLDPGALSP